MRRTKSEKVQAGGWRIGSTAEFLDLSPDEVALIEIKSRLAKALRERRVHKRLTQTQLAKLLHSSQSRIAKMEVADASVSVDLLMRALLSLGYSPQDLARVIQARRSQKVA